MRATRPGNGLLKTAMTLAVLLCIATGARALPFDTDLRLWLAADAGAYSDAGLTPATDGDTVQQWNDQLQGDNTVAENATQGTASARPTYIANGLHGMPVLRFAGPDNLNGQGGLVLSAGDAARTVVIVGNSPTATSSTNWEVFDLNRGAVTGQPSIYRITPEIGMRQNSGNRMYTSDTLGPTYTVLAFQTPGAPNCNTGNTQAFRDSTSPLTPSSTASPTLALNTLNGGYRVAGVNFAGDIAEILVYERVLSSTELDQVGDYLSQKYDLPTLFGTQIAFDDGDPADHDWSRPNNWNPDGEPTAADDVVIGASFNPVVTQAGEVAKTVFVGHNAGSPTAALTVQSGSLSTTNDLCLGNDGYAGNLTQTGGDVNVGRDLLFGAIGGRGGTYRLNGGTLNVAGEVRERISAVDPAHLYIDGGTLNVAGDITVQSFRTGDAAGKTGSYTLTAGKKLTNTGTFFVGQAGTGTFDLQGGTVAITNGARIGDAGNGTGTLNITGGTMNVNGGDLIFGNNGGKGGSVLLDSGTLKVTGDIITKPSATSTLTYDGGTLSVSTGNIQVTTFHLARNKGKGYTHSKGTLEADDLYIGGVADGTLSQTGGTVTVNNDLVFGPDYPTTNQGGTYNLYAGTLDVKGSIVEQHSNVDSAQLHIDGGTLLVGGNITVQSFRTGNAAGKTGSFTLDGGRTLTNTGTVFVGNLGNGTTKIIDGASATVANGVRIGYEASGVGTLEIGDASTAGTLTANAGGDGQTYVGYKGQGTLNLINGSLTANKGFYAAYSGTASTGDVVMGDGTTSPTLSVSGANLEVGTAGTGSFTQHSGTVDVLTHNLIVGQTTTGVGTYTLHGGTVHTHGTTSSVGLLRVGNSGWGEFIQQAGDVIVGSILDLGNNDNPNSDGTYRLKGGTLDVAGDMRVGNLRTGRLRYEGGTLTLGGVLYIGGYDSTSPGAAPNADGTFTLGTATSTPTLNTGQLEVGRHNQGTFEHVDGTLNVDAGNLVLSQYANSAGTYHMTGGTLNVSAAGGTDTINFNQGKGVFNQDGGTVNAHYGINMAQNDTPSTHEWNLTAGTLNVYNKNFELGRYGKAAFTQDGGDVVIGASATEGNLVLGQEATGDARYEINAGSLTCNNQLNVANRGVGTFVQDGGLVTVGAELQIGNTGNEPNTNGLYQVNSGTLKVGTQMRAGNADLGRFEQTGGDVTIGSDLITGYGNYAGCDGTYSLIGGTLDVGKYLIVGGTTSTSPTAAPKSNGTFNLGDGTTSPAIEMRSNVEVGRHGTGVFNHNSGSLTILTDHNLVLGQYAGSSGTYTMTGGTLTTTKTGSGVNGHIRVNQGTGVFNQQGGTVSLGGNIELTSGASGDGTYNLSGGTLDLNGGRISYGPGTAAFHITGGRLQNLGSFHPSAPTGPLADASGNGFDGTPTDDVGHGPGVLGKAASFDGTDSVVSFGDVDALDAVGAFSVAMWFNRRTDLTTATNHGVNNVLVAQSSVATNDNLEIGTSGPNIEIYLDTIGQDGPGPFAVNAGIADDTWYHLAMTYDKDAADGNEMRLYLDGSLVTAQSQWGGTLDPSGTSPLALGLARPGDEEWGDYDGRIDDFAVWTHALDAADVATLFNAGAGTPASALPAGLLLYTPMDDIAFTGTFVQDGGVLAPGSSPGITAIDGDALFHDGTIEIEIQDPGLLAGTDYDLVSIAGDAVLDNILQIALLDGFVPGHFQYFDVLTAESIALGPGFELDQTQAQMLDDYFIANIVPGGNGEILRLRFVPEPASLSLLALGTLALLARRRRR